MQHCGVGDTAPALPITKNVLVATSELPKISPGKPKSQISWEALPEQYLYCWTNSVVEIGYFSVCQAEHFPLCRRGHFITLSSSLKASM